MIRQILSASLWTRIALLAAVTVMLGCSPTEAAKGEKGEPDPAAAMQKQPLRVVTTTGMIADAARNIGGQWVEVTALMGPGVDPHLYKATKGDLDLLAGADVILYNGLHLEGKLADVLVKMASRVKTVAVTEGMPEDQLREPPEFAGHHDPHVWFDVKLWTAVIPVIRDAFTDLYPVRVRDFMDRSKAYEEQLVQLDGYARAQIATIPKDQRVLVTAHDAFGYFGRAYEIEVMGLQGISTASEYGLGDLERVAEAIVQRKVKAVFVESSIPTKSIEALVRGVEAKGHKIMIGGELFSDAMGSEGTPEGTYEGMVRHNVDTIVAALK